MTKKPSVPTPRQQLEKENLQLLRAAVSRQFRPLTPEAFKIAVTEINEAQCQEHVLIRYALHLFNLPQDMRPALTGVALTALKNVEPAKTVRLPGVTT